MRSEKPPSACCGAHRVSSQEYQEDVSAELEDAVDTRQLLKHDGVTDPAEELPHELPDDQDHRRIETHNAAGGTRQCQQC